MLNPNPYLSGIVRHSASCILFIASVLLTAPVSHAAKIDLSGTWRFELDDAKLGVDAGWHRKTLEDELTLPGTTDENKKGILQDEAPTDRLARVWFWKGAAWYQKDVTIPESWAGKRITLFLERTKYTRVWVDDTFIGYDDTLSAPQIFDLSKELTPGEHTITLVIDNSITPPTGPSHAIDERTQTNWNGIVGQIELQATDPVWIEQVQAYPDLDSGKVRIRAELRNMTGSSAQGRIEVNAHTTNVSKPVHYDAMQVDYSINQERQWIDFIYNPGAEIPRWDEFNTTLVQLSLQLEARSETKTYADHKTIRFGMTEFSRDGNQLLVNGEPVFLRGRLDCANYPLTGYPPMDKASWLRIIGILKEWGLNHVRFHSWCPPKAAFEAADELGMYLQAELPNKRSGFHKGNPKLESAKEEAAEHNIDRLAVNEEEYKVSLFDFGKREGELILKHFGNSPSFNMFTLGNELGRNEAMFKLVDYFRNVDPRKLYAQGSNNMHWNPSLAEGDDFWVAKSLAKSDKIVRGSDSVFSHGLIPHIENLPPSSMVDYVEAIADCPVPVIGHETGQFQVYPDFRDIPKFTGVTRAKNFEIFRERLKEAGMLDQAQEFVDASGALAAICYREDIEAALRTPGFGGFHLLDIQDFPGQGTALVGMLNDFMQPKGFIEAAEWRAFCNEVVPLLRMESYVWSEDQTLIADLELAHYGPMDFPDGLIRVTVMNSAGNPLHSVNYNDIDLAAGGLNRIGKLAIQFPELDLSPPQQLSLKIDLLGTAYTNQYPIWVYPSEIETAIPENVLVTRSFGERKTQQHLENGGRVLLLPQLEQLPHSVPGAFQTDFWSPMFSVAAINRGLEPAPGTLGILCDPDHPAFAAFPTESHSNWQWWHLNKNSRPVVLDETPDNYRPTVQVIDNFVRNHKLGVIFETKVGNGSMLVCSIDLPALQHRPEARQLMRSLLDYLAAEHFAPDAEIETSILEKLFPH